MTRSAEQIFHEAREMLSAEQGAYLKGACGGDAALRAKVEGLLKADAEAGEFLKTSDESAPTVGVEVAAATMAAPLREGPGTRIGPYKILQAIGEGGFGSVFMAQQEQPVQRKVALKIIKLGMDTRQVVARFEQERQALAMMDHPNIARVLDAGATETGRPFFVMELVKGDPIVEYADKNNLSIQDRLELFAQVCNAVQHAHTKGIIHRDIKPSNVLVSTQDGRPHTKVIDFGIAKATASKLTEKTLFTEHRQLIGTPEYMSPEQAEGNLDIDTRTDVYSLGVLLYELLTGTTPFSSKELRSAAYAEIQRIIREVEPPKPSTRISANTDTIAKVASKRHTEPKRLGTIIRGELDWIVMKALEKDRQRRYETANGLAMDIRRYLSGEAVVAAPPGTAYRFKKFVRRNRGPVLAGSAVAAALLIGAVAFAWQAQVARNQRDLALAAQQAEAEQRKQADAARAQAVEQRARAEAQEAEARKQEAQAREQEAEAKKQAAIAEAVAKFLTDMLAAVDPGQLPKDPVTGEPLKDAVTVVQAMAAAVKTLDEGGGALKDQPLVEARVRETIGNTLYELGRYADAEPNVRKALSLRREVLPEGHPDIAQGLNNLAGLLQAQNRLAEAEPLFREALQIYRASLPTGHPTITLGLNNLAGLLYTRNKLAEAEPLMREALEVRRGALPAGHPDIAQGLNNLAMLLKARNKLAEAEPLFREALHIYRTALPAGHPDIAIGLTNLAGLLYTQNKFAEAEPLYREALQIRRAALPNRHPHIAEVLNNLAGLMYAQNKLAEAEPLYREALAIYRAALPAGHPDIASSLSNLAGLLMAQEKLAEAEKLYREALQIRRAAFPAGHPKLLTAMRNLGDLYAHQGKADEALRLLREVIESSRATLPKDSPELADRLAASSQALLGLKLWDEAEPLLRECLAIREKAEPDAWTTFNTKSTLGGVLLGQNKTTESEPLLLEGYKGMKDREAAIPPQGKVRIAEALERLVRLYEAKGNEPEAAAWRTRLEAAKVEQAGPNPKGGK